MKRAVIVGGGVAGLTAAHELIERNFQVTLYERRARLGGKAASGHRADRTKDRPTEHGFRFFPGWYRHLPDTMGRIPYLGRRKYFDGANVKDNLVTVDRNILAEYDRGPIASLMHLPRNLSELQTLFKFAAELHRLDMPMSELLFFFRQLMSFVRASEAERGAFDQITWWQFLEADDKSPAFRALIAATTRTMVAAKAKQASAYTIAKMALRTFADAVTAIDRVLCGPTSEVWIDPWVEYLEARGVEFRTGFELDAIAFEGAEAKIINLRFGHVEDQQALRSLRAATEAARDFHRTLCLVVAGGAELGSSSSASPAVSPKPPTPRPAGGRSGRTTSSRRFGPRSPPSARRSRRTVEDRAPTRGPIFPCCPIWTR